MSYFIHNIIRSATEEDNKYNILCIYFDGLFEFLLSQTPHEFYVILPPNIQQTWLSKTLPKIPNLHFYDHIINIPQYIEFDAILCSDRVRLHQYALSISRALHIPLIYVDHQDLSNYKAEDLFLISNNRGKIHICASNVFTQVAQFNYDNIINYGIPIQQIESNATNDIIIIGDYPQQSVLLNALQNKFKVVIVNEKQHPANFADIINLFLQSKLFLNFNPDNNISIVMLIAMSYGCVPICNHRNIASKIINNGYNGIVNKSPQEMFDQIKRIIDNPTIIQQMSRATIESIQIQFNQQHFINQWNNVFSKLNEMVYIG